MSANVNTYDHSSDGSPERKVYNHNDKTYDPNVQGSTEVEEAEDNNHHLHRNLSSRQITMIAIGGAIGTGLIIGTGKSLRQSGPAPLFIGYTLVGFLCFLVMAALGEMAAWLPLPSGFTGYATRFVDPALGFCLGWNYWFKYIIVTPNNLTAASLVLQYWVSRDTVNPGAFIAVFLVAIVIINYFGVKFFGEFEFWLSSVKVVVILGLILLSLILACGGGPHGATGFQYWRNPGAFHEYILKGAAGRFLATWATFTTAVFAYLGTELVGVTVGEASNPRKVIPRAIKLTFYRILLFYVVLVFLLGMLVPYNSVDLKTAIEKGGNTAAASPFVVAIINAGIPTLPGILNACVMIFVFSAANSDLYIASRTLFGLAHEGKAPKIFTRTDKRGVPIYALGLSVAFCLLAFLGVSTDSYTVFGYFVNLVTMFGLLTWISILIAHICFVNARKAQGIPDSALAYVAPCGKWGSVGALAFSILIAIFKGFALFCWKKLGQKRFDTETFVTTYLGFPLYFIMYFGYKFYMKTSIIKSEDVDLYSGKARIDREEQEYLAAEMERKGIPETKWERIYRLTLGWAF
ncbi:probable DIP5 Glutamate and aspartate permease-able to mediate transport of other amino acids [Rhynchosporium graminicola]|uniref:Probable DIP5 Glutamate and aspartate permease-able to mediate transport of other amino acids n=2 Tax=Rhynchosporium TaxID=38037 RepID=A0A1E1M6D8_RHYSE|nr:probable DIP5 Glutamate and aspartate permease-able to mediate transport of other amino acids [Rhynchosporium commune]CZT44175.1 probable DIP5 Glutamate and aspartate permease-able to mediate transport of other amino acids [Rhynchosporium secalis]